MDRGAELNPPTDSLVRFFALVAALSVPFYILGALTRFELLPRLPVSALVAICPAVAALILSRREGDRGSLLRSAVDFRPIMRRPALAVAILLAPAAEWASYLLPSAVESSAHVTSLSPLQLTALASTFLVAAIGEEIGWSGYAVGRLRPQASSLRTGVEIGAFWAAWHVLPLVSVGRSAGWIAWWGLATIAQRIVFVWLYRSANGSVGAVALSHALHNLVWILIPSFGSEYDPRADAVATVVAAVTVVGTLPPKGTSERNVPKRG